MDNEDYEFSKIKIRLLHNILPVYVSTNVVSQS